MGNEDVFGESPEQTRELGGAFAGPRLDHLPPTAIDARLDHAGQHLVEALTLEMIKPDFHQAPIRQTPASGQGVTEFRAWALRHPWQKLELGSAIWGTSKMKLQAIVVTGALVFLSIPASAASLCNCCSSSTAANCQAACAPVKPAAGQCVATVDFAGKPEISDGANPLYDMSLRNMWLGSPSADQLESFRKLLELSRKGAEADRRVALRQFAKGKISKDEADTATKRYDDAIVNYFLGFHSYSEAKRAH